MLQGWNWHSFCHEVRSAPLRTVVSNMRFTLTTLEVWFHHVTTEPCFVQTLPNVQQEFSSRVNLDPQRFISSSRRPPQLTLTPPNEFFFRLQLLYKGPHLWLTKCYSLCTAHKRGHTVWVSRQDRVPCLIISWVNHSERTSTGLVSKLFCPLPQRKAVTTSSPTTWDHNREPRAPTPTSWS